MTPTPMTFNGPIVNLQLVFGGNPTINNYAPAESPRPARSTHPSRSYSSSASDVSAVSAAAQDHPTVSTSRSHCARAAPHILSPSPRLETSPASASLLSPIGSPMANLNSLQSHALVNQNPSRSLTAESLPVSHFPQPAVHAHSNAVGSRVRSHESQDDSTADMNGSTQRA